jgi:hypothetical protein
LAAVPLGASAVQSAVGPRVVTAAAGTGIRLTGCSKIAEAEAAVSD